MVMDASLQLMSARLPTLWSHYVRSSNSCGTSDMKRLSNPSNHTGLICINALPCIPSVLLLWLTTSSRTSEWVIHEEHLGKAYTVGYETKYTQFNFHYISVLVKYLYLWWALESNHGIYIHLAISLYIYILLTLEKQLSGSSCSVALPSRTQETHTHLPHPVNEHWWMVATRHSSREIKLHSTGRLISCSIGWSCDWTAVKRTYQNLSSHKIMVLCNLLYIIRKSQTGSCI